MWNHKTVSLFSIVIVLSVCAVLVTRAYSAVSVSRSRTVSASAQALAAGQQSGSGVVIEKITPRSELEKAGVREGDILLNWTRDGQSGVLESPIDLLNVEEEQKPLGVVHVEGMRAGQRQSWELGLGVWGVIARQNLNGPELSAYKSGEEMFQAKRNAEATEQWRIAATEAGKKNRKAAAWILYHAAESMANARQWQAAQGLFEQAVEAARPEPVFLARIYWRRAEISRLAKDWEAATKNDDLALAEVRKLATESLMEAAVVQDQGTGCLERNDLVCAKTYLIKSLAMRERLAPKSLAIVKSLNGLATLALRADDLSEAERLMMRVLEIRERLLPGSVEVAITFNNLGAIAERNGDLRIAETYFQKALVAKEKLAPGTQELANAYNNLAIVSVDRGDLDKAEELHHQALAIETKLDPKSMDVVASLVNLGGVYEYRHDFAKAEDCYDRARKIINEKDPNHEYMANVVHNLGVMFMDMGEFDKAATYLTEAVRRKEKLSSESLALAASFAALGEVEYDRGNPVQADAGYKSALALYEKLAPHNIALGDLLNRRAEIAMSRGEYAQAEEFYRRALSIWEAGSSGSVWYAESLIGMARLVRRRDPAGALPWFGRAIAAMESQATRFGGSDEVRAGFRANHAGYYSDYIDLLVQQGKLETAVEFSESARARTLLELLDSQHVNVRQGLDPALRERERSLRSEISAKVGRRLTLRTDKQNEAALREIEKEIEGLLSQYQDVETQIRATSPAYAALTRPQPLTALQIRQQLLDPDTALLEYSLGEERSYVFVVTQSGVQAVVLPPRRDIEQAARSFHAQVRNNLDRKKFDAAALQLSSMVLKPVAAQLVYKRLLVVPDGALHYVPFAALIVSAAPAGERVRTARPLAMDHEIVNLPSASVLAELRRMQKSRVPAEKQLAVLADPVFDREDVRVQRQADRTLAALVSAKAQAETQGKMDDEDALAKVTRSAADVGMIRDGKLSLARLRYSRREALNILALVQPKQELKALDFKASRALALDPEVANYRLVHFATHGLIDSQHPESSGLVFSLVDSQGSTQNGFLSLEDIYNLNLRADLVVLSACDTGLGKEIRGEGLVGLTRGFMYAGASRVVASLWSVSDAATAEFMKAFYEAMLGNKLTPAAALHAAQLKMAKQPRWSSPYYWAAFQLQGEWK